jgi:hypothetical protein
MSQRRKVVTVRTRPQPKTSLRDVAESPLYGVAMLKIAMELKKPQPRALDDILTGVLQRMRIPEEHFRDFLAQNGGLLRAIAQRRQY